MKLWMAYIVAKMLCEPVMTILPCELMRNVSRGFSKCAMAAGNSRGVSSFHGNRFTRSWMSMQTPRLHTETMLTHISSRNSIVCDAQPPDRARLQRPPRDRLIFKVLVAISRHGQLDMGIAKHIGLFLRPSRFMCRFLADLRGKLSLLREATRYDLIGRIDDIENTVQYTGGAHDILVYIMEAVNEFIIVRLTLGCRWILNIFPYYRAHQYCSRTCERPCITHRARVFFHDHDPQALHLR